MKSLLFTTVLSLLYAFIYSQDGLIGGVTINGVTTKFINGLPVINSPKHDSIIKYSDHVIGNSFYFHEYIGMSSVDPVWSEKWTPIDGYKRIISGHLSGFYFRTPYTDGGDDDLNFQINPNLNNSYLRKYLDSKSLNNCKMIYEIDIHDIDQIKMYPYLSYMPVKGLDNLNAYGPFVIDNHGNIEIHPAEQVWWRNKLGNDDLYHLFFMSDNSGNFTGTNWQKNPLTGTFALAFSCFKDSQKIKYDISFINQKNSSLRSNDGKKHYLINRTDTLVTISEPDFDFLPSSLNYDFLDITFEDVYIDKQVLEMQKDTLIKGYVVIKSRIGNVDDYAGNILLSVLKKTEGYAPGTISGIVLNPGGPVIKVSEPTEKIKITLTSMVANGIDDEGTAEEIYGYVSVGAFASGTTSLIQPLETKQDPKHNNILWASLDDHGETQLKFGRKGEVKQLNISRTFYAHQLTSLKIIADLNEDDESYPDGPKNYNSTESDDEDDKLNRYCDVCEESLDVKSIIYGKPVYKNIKFSSGGTEIQVNFRIERIP